MCNRDGETTFSDKASVSAAAPTRRSYLRRCHRLKKPSKFRGIGAFSSELRNA